MIESVDQRRRRLLVATTAVGAAGIGFAAVPFVASMGPSARALAARGPQEVDFSKLKAGEQMTVEWQGKPIWILRRTADMLARLKSNAPLLADPNSEVVTQQPGYAQNLGRSIQPEVFVVIGICTHLGCVPLQRFVPGAASGLGEAWPGGYFCPCHGSKFDLAGRVFKKVPAPTNLVVPRYHFLADTRAVIGVDPPAGR